MNSNSTRTSTFNYYSAAAHDNELASEWINDAFLWPLETSASAASVASASVPAESSSASAGPVSARSDSFVSGAGEPAFDSSAFGYETMTPESANVSPPSSTELNVMATSEYAAAAYAYESWLASQHYYQQGFFPGMVMMPLAPSAAAPPSPASTADQSLSPSISLAKISPTVSHQDPELQQEKDDFELSLAANPDRKLTASEKKKLREYARNLTCFNCKTSKTPLWRRTADKEHNLCNACGLYFKQYNTHRPVAYKDRNPRANKKESSAGVSKKSKTISAPAPPPLSGFEDVLASVVPNPSTASQDSLVTLNLAQLQVLLNAAKNSATSA
ncbi:putative electron transfer flavoprotein subunit [Kappamyces sp. JEL0680]|nr:putative electron transfer flavoprotein subunit [Kappamyces sp. JEL0680]